MRTSIKILVILFVVITSSVIFTKQASAQQPYVSFQVFYDDLSPYGQWVNYSNFGYVWIPDAGPDFFPYSTGGHWIQTEYGLTWLSDYEWGWAPFHYGRWDYDDYFGWFWVPDNEWGPAWVTWRRAEGYYGWQPMQPGISISLSFDRGYDSHYDHWIFVRDRYIDRPNLNRYYANRTDHERIIRNSTVINNTYVDNRRQATYVSGPARDDIQRTTGRRVKPVAIQENSRPGQNMRNGQLQIYRPQVRNNDQGQKPVPSRVVNQSDVRRPSERNATNQTGNVNQPGNNRRVQQQNTVNKQNNNNTAKPVQTQNANPAQNNRRVVQQQQQKQQQQRQQEQQKQQQQQEQQKQQQKEQQQQQKQKQQQQNVNPTNNNRRQQQKNTVKPSKNSKNVQQKKSRSEQDKK